MTLEEMLDEPPKACNVGSKKNSKGYKETWVGYKLHIDAAGGQIPISCIVTSAFLHDSQAAIPLACMTSQRVTNLYDLGDSAYDAQAIHEYIRSLGHTPLIDVHPRCDQALMMVVVNAVRPRLSVAARVPLAFGPSVAWLPFESSSVPVEETVVPSGCTTFSG
jgi:hypothetical protein